MIIMEESPPSKIHRRRFAENGCPKTIDEAYYVEKTVEDWWNWLRGLLRLLPKFAS